MIVWDHLNDIYTHMVGFYNIGKVKTDAYGKPILTSKTPEDFKYLLGLNVNDIILFDDGNEELLNSGAIILPRHYKIFIGNKDGELQLKPYENNPHRIVVTTYSGIIASIDSIG